MSDNIIRVYCRLKEELSHEVYESLWKLAESLKVEIEKTSDFTLSWGPKDDKSKDLRLYLKRNIHKNGYDASVARNIVDIIFERIKTTIPYFILAESSLTSDFPLAEDDLIKESAITYHYRLEEVLPLK